uniref:Uncharacterized protein n=1 Tax=Seriola lalandi dorsalis TaxID=1841481 RepID=A0A3B4WRM4_SERLL
DGAIDANKDQPVFHPKSRDISLQDKNVKLMVALDQTIHTIHPTNQLHEISLLAGHINVKGGVEASVRLLGLADVIDTYDRPKKAFVVGDYAHGKKYREGFEDKPGKRIPSAGFHAAAGLGHARAELSVFDAEVKGPNVCIGAGASVGSLGAAAYAKAELVSASVTAGPIKATVGLSLDTGISVGVTGFQAKLLGTSFSIGPKISFSFFGTGFEMSLL